MKIGRHELRNDLFLAPMAGVTDRPFRQLCKRLGAGMAASEMVSSNSLLWGSDKTRRRADHTGEDEPRAVQIAGADAGMMAQAARYNVDRGAQIIDINMGCPAKKVCNVMAGSALLQHESLVARILRAVVNAVEVPVTLKIRTGWDRAHRNGPRIARIAEDEGVQALAVHGRTRADLFQGEAEFETVALIKQAVRIPVIANGDITTPEKAAEVLRRSGADGIMIGRAAQGNPWIFRQIGHFLASGQNLAPPPVAEVRDTLLAHLANLYAFYGEYTGVRVARKHIAWYSKGLFGGAAFRQRVNQAEMAEAQTALVREFFDNTGSREARSAHSAAQGCANAVRAQDARSGPPPLAGEGMREGAGSRAAPVEQSAGACAPRLAPLARASGRGDGGEGSEGARAATHEGMRRRERGQGLSDTLYLRRAGLAA